MKFYLHKIKLSFSYLFMWHLESLKFLATLKIFFKCLETSRLPEKVYVRHLLPVCVWHLLWHGASVYNRHLWKPITFTPIVKHLEVELTLTVLKTEVCSGWDSNTKPIACEIKALADCVTTAADEIWDTFLKNHFLS